MVKVDIISGFLGAGKTTLIKKLIDESLKDEKIMIIENEFGEIGIDGGFLKDTGIKINEINSGCICCSLVGDFGKALEEAVDEYVPDRIIIEPSGVGKLSDVIKAVKEVEKNKDLKLNAVVTVINSLKCSMYMKNFGEFFNNQIENAKTIILTRTDRFEDRLQLVIDDIRKYNSEASIITTPIEKIDGDKILSVMEEKNDFLNDLIKDEEECCHHEHCNHEHHHHHNCNHEHHHHHADDVFSNFGLETIKKFSKEDLEEILKELISSKEYGNILRAKGILKDTENKWISFDLVCDEYEIRESSADYSGRLCVIGVDLKKEKLKELFEKGRR